MGDNINVRGVMQILEVHYVEYILRVLGLCPDF